MSTAPRPHTSPSTISPPNGSRCQPSGVHRHDVGVAHQQQRRRVRDRCPRCARRGSRGPGCGVVALEVEAGVAEVLREHVGAARLEPRLGRAVVHALVADEVREEVGDSRRDDGVVGRRSCGAASGSHAVDEHAVLVPPLGRRPRSPGARGGRTSRSRPSCPSAASGTPRATARRTVAGPSASRRVAQLLHALGVMFLDRLDAARARRRTGGRARAGRASRRRAAATRSSVARYDFNESALRTPETCGVIDGSTWSPVSSVPVSGSHTQRWSTVWPGVCTTNQSRPGEPHPFAVVHAVGRLGRREQHPHRVDHHLALAAAGPGWSCPTASSRPTGSTSPRSRRCRRARRRRRRRSSGSRRARRRRTARPRRLRARAAALRLRSAPGAALGPFTVHVENAWCVMSFASASRAMRPAPPKWSGCECVTTTVWTSLMLVAGGLEPGFNAFHDCGPGRPGSTTAMPVVVDEAVHVHVTEAGHPDRQLHAQHAGRDLGDLLRRWLLLLARRRVAREPSVSVGHGRRRYW